MTIWEDIKWQYKYGSDLIKLILINIAIFLIVNLISLPFALFKANNPIDVVSWFSLYASFKNLLTHPWGIFTYMFLHQDFFHILYNMIGLYWFGNIVQDLIGKPKVLPIFLYGGVAGAILYVLAYNVFPLFSNVLAGASNIGASAGVLAIVLAATTISPDYEIGLMFIGRVKIKWIALVYVLLDLINIQHGNAGGHIAHLGGALFGYTYIKLLQNGTDLARPIYAVTDFFSNLFSKKNKLKVEYKKETDKEKEYASTASSTHKQNTSSTKQELNKQDKLDAILDKINRSSYDSLSKEEKDFLFKISQED
jgi:membrane associated rhomboid family serine protease